METFGTRRELLSVDRAQHEAEKAIRFASLHGEWPLGLSPRAGAAILRRGDSDDLQRRWGDLADAALGLHEHEPRTRRLG